MKHCKNCKHCSMDMVSQYMKGIDIYSCELTNRIISQPFWGKCEKYEKDNYCIGGFHKWFSDWVFR